MSQARFQSADKHVAPDSFLTPVINPTLKAQPYTARVYALPI